MSEDILAEWRESQNQDTNDHIDQEKTPTKESPHATQQAQQRPKYSLDDVDLDDPRLPPSLRGQPASALFSDREKFMHEAKHAGFERNRFATEAETFKAALEIAARRFNGNGSSDEKANVALPSPADQLRARGLDPNTILSEPERIVGMGVEIAEERIMPRVRSEAAELQKRIEELEKERAQERQLREEDRIRNAFHSARPQNVSNEDWLEDADLIAAFVVANRLPPDDPASHQSAYQAIEKRRSSRQSKNLTQGTTPVLATVAAPPVGAGKTAAAPTTAQKSRARISTHQKHAFDKVTKIFKELSPTLDTDAILDELIDDPKYGGMFQ